MGETTTAFLPLKPLHIIKLEADKMFIISETIYFVFIHKVTYLSSEKYAFIFIMSLSLRIDDGYKGNKTELHHLTKALFLLDIIFYYLTVN